MKELLDHVGCGMVEDKSSMYEVKTLSKYPLIAPPKNYFWAKVVERM